MKIGLVHVEASVIQIALDNYQKELERLTKQRKKDIEAVKLTWWDKMWLLRCLNNKLPS